MIAFYGCVCSAGSRWFRMKNMRIERKCRKYLALLCSVLLLTLSVPTAAASDGPIQPISADAAQQGELTPPETSAPSYVVMEQTTGGVAAEKDAHKLLPPASLAKMMTTLLVLEAAEAGTIGLGDLVTASENACNMGGVEIWLTPGEQMTVEDLLIAISIGSGNDAAVALAEYISGSEEAFVALMNRKAKQIGMDDTNFLDASGYHSQSQTSAYDMALLSCELLRHEKAAEYATIWMHDLRGGATQLVNTNRLVRFYDGCTGLKTGVSEQSGNCISASASKGEKAFVAVAMGIEKTEDSFEDAKALLNFGFDNFTVAVPEVEPSLIHPVKITGGVKNETLPEISGSTAVLIPAGKSSELNIEAAVADEVEAPVRVGQQLGIVKISLGGEVLDERAVLAAEDVEAMTFWNAFLILLRRLLC